MKQITIKGFAHCKPANKWNTEDSNYRDGFSYDFCHVELEGDGFIKAGTATLTIDLPEGFDPRAGAVETLKAEKQKIMAEFQARINQIDQQISQYTAIECEVQA
jgi:hypothetical protein